VVAFIGGNRGRYLKVKKGKQGTNAFRRSDKIQENKNGKKAQVDKNGKTL